MTRAAIFCLVLVLFACEERSPQVRFAKRSEFERIFVVDEGEMRHLRFGSAHGGNQSSISISDPSAVPVEYIRFAMLGMLLTSKQERVLMIGLGGGTFTTLLRRHYPNVWIDAVEIDLVVVEAAKGFFGVREDERFRIHIEDGALFIQQTQNSYDLIMVDAYTGEGVPQDLASPEFFGAVRARLSNGGVVVLNIWDEGRREHLIEKVFRSTFPETACIRSEDGYNLVLFGKASEGMPRHEDLEKAAHRFTSDLDLSFDLGQIAEELAIECSGTRLPGGRFETRTGSRP